MSPDSEHTQSPPASLHPPSTLSNILKSFARGATRGQPAPSSTPAATPKEHDLHHSRHAVHNLVGSSSRGAGVRPTKTPAEGVGSTSAREYATHEIYDPAMAHLIAREAAGGAQLIAGPSRGGFIAHAHPAPLPSKAAPSIAAPPQAVSSLQVSQSFAPLDSPSIASRPRSVAPPIAIVSDSDPILPPSKILRQLSELVQHSSDPVALVALLRHLAKSVLLYPFPPPPLAAASLAEALVIYTTAPADFVPPKIVITPAPLHIYLSQSHFLSQSSPPEVRIALLELLLACVEASLGSTGGMKEGEKAVFWDETRRWADEAKVEVDNGQGGTRWVLPDLDREALVAILSSLTRGGKDLSDVPGLVALLCTFVTDSLPVPRPPSPLWDTTLSTPFTQTTPYTPGGHTSALALLTSLHKLSAPHIYTASTLLALRSALQVARLQEERDIEGSADAGVLAFIGTVVRFGEVTGGEAARRRREIFAGFRPADGPEQNEGEEILREVVAVVARMIGCEGLVGVVEVEAGRKLGKVYDERIRPSILPPLALDLMRDLLRSPANQALKSLRGTLIAPPPDVPRPPTPVLLLVGALRALRKALLEHSADVEASALRKESALLTTGESRWPSMLALGLPFLWNSLCRVMQWESGHVDGEVLRLIDERLEASGKVGARVRAAAAAASTALPGETVEEAGTSYEEWDMAIEALGKTKWHIAAWEEAKRRRWTVDGGGLTGDDPDSSEDESDGPAVAQFTRRPDVLAAFALLLRRIVHAWRRPGFTGPSERLFNLLVSLAPHLSDEYASIVLEQCELNNLCLPCHVEWLERVQEVVKAFYVVPTSTATKRHAQRGSSSNTRLRALHLIISVHQHLRHFVPLREKLVGTVVLPLLEMTFERETDPSVSAVFISLVLEITRDSLWLDQDESEDDGRLGVFDRLRLLLLRVAKRSRRERTLSSAGPTTPRVQRGLGLTSLSRYQSETSPGGLRSSGSLSGAISNSLSQKSVSTPPADTAYQAVMALISIFHACLARSTPHSSNQAIVIFRDLLLLLSPAVNSQTDPTADPSLSVRNRLVILQWLVRLRADASHRILWIQNVDIAVSAKILGRVVVPTDESAEDGTASRNSEDGGRPEVRGRTARGQAVDRSGREASGSRLRMQSEERSPNRTNAGKNSSRSLSPTLWTYPETIPFDFGTDLSSSGVSGLHSFDHNRMREWREEEDPGTGIVEVKVTESGAEGEEPMLVLPISEYLRTINHLLQSEPEWELVSYILCHLPEQLSNKHFQCGPRGAQQLHTLRHQLCAGLRGGAGAFFSEVVLPPGVKRAEVYAAAYHCLTALIAYRSLFNKSQQDDMVETFMYGLGNPRDTAKPCIHALAMCAFELRPSMTKHLAEIVRHLQKIISSATLGVHILELMAGVGQEPSLYANFTEIDFQTVFGIALKYIQAHNERLADNPQSFDAEEGLEYAFSQYVFLLAYYVIASWYMALRLPERQKYVPFLTRRLVQANEGKPEIDEQTEVCFDMIARYAYSNADPRPRRSAFDKIITAGVSPTVASSKTWIVGHATVTVTGTPAPAWVEVTIRRASGVVRMLWELQNMSGVASSTDGDLIAMHLRHRESTQISQGIPSIVSEALATLPHTRIQPHLGHRARSQSFSGSSSNASPALIIEQNTVSNAINSAATVATQPTLDSGLLAVDPSFFTLQLSSFPLLDSSSTPLLVPSEPAFQRLLGNLDLIPVVDAHSIGVLYVGPGQTTEAEILSNTHGSKAYIEFISALGRLIRLQGSRALGLYAAGLDQERDEDGKWTYVWDDDISQIVFHIATLMPSHPDTDTIMKKRHIGNDFVKIIFNDSGSEFAFDTLPSEFNFVNIIIQPHTPAGNPWIGPGMTNNSAFFKVSMQCRPGMPEVGPLGTFKMVTGSSLPNFVRQLSLHSNIFAQIYLASVGLTSRQGGGKYKVEYSSNWRRRLQTVKMLKERVTTASGTAAPRPDLTGPLSLDQEEAARLFVSWL